MFDAELEAAIDRAGRDRVFAIVRASGWTSGDYVPTFVWWEAVRLASQRNEQPPRSFKSFLGQ